MGIPNLLYNRKWNLEDLYPSYREVWMLSQLFENLLGLHKEVLMIRNTIICKAPFECVMGPKITRTP